tara:strand:- start:388 stop:855 length:468 start_codon:yes stop_codon:yes gene_type:complete
MCRAKRFTRRHIALWQYLIAVGIVLTLLCSGLFLLVDGWQQWHYCVIGVLGTVLSIWVAVQFFRELRFIQSIDWIEFKPGIIELKISGHVLQFKIPDDLIAVHTDNQKTVGIRLKYAGRNRVIQYANFENREQMHDELIAAAGKNKTAIPIEHKL